MIVRLVFAAVALAGCTELPELQGGVCGNGIVENREDCDHRDPKCVSCSWECDDDGGCTRAGPSFRCGIDNVCYGPSGKFDSAPRAQHAFPVLGFRITDIDGDGIGDVVGLNRTALNVRYGETSGELPEWYNVVTPQVAGNPVLTHLVDDTIDDMVMPTADGLVVYTGLFGVPSPRQFPLGGDEGPENMGGRPDPFDAVQIDDTIGLFGPHDDTPGVTQYLRFGLISITPFGPGFDAETDNLCGVQETSNPFVPNAKWHNGAVSSYRSASGVNFVAFYNDNKTCVIKVSRRAMPVARSPSIPDCKPSEGGAPQCYYTIETVGSYMPALTAPQFAELDGSGCPSLIVNDDDVPGTLAVYPAQTGCQLASSPRPERITLTGDPDSTRVIGAIRLDPDLPCLDPPACTIAAAPDALITRFGIHAVPTDATSPWPVATDPLYISDRSVERAVVGDLDGNGEADVAFSTDMPNLDVARRVPGQKYFLLVRTPTSGPVVQTVIADYDGDQRPDLAYVEDLGSAQRLSIAYGSANGLEPGIAADVFRRVEFIAHMAVPDSTDPFNLVDDLIAIDIAAPGEPEITILHGSPSRTMLSFFGLPVPVQGASFSGVVGGDFVDSTVTLMGAVDTRTEGTTDLVAFQTFSVPSPVCAAWNCNTALWILPGLPNARLGDVQGATGGMMGDPLVLPNTTLVGRCSASARPAFCVEDSKLVAWPVIKRTVPPEESNEAVDHDIVIGVDEGANVLRLDPAAPASLTVTAGPFRAGGRLHELLVFDTDGDGLEELVAPFASTGNRDGHVDICRMNRDGSFAESTCQDAATIIGDPDLECVAAVAGSTLAACTPDGQTARLAVLCRGPAPDDLAQTSGNRSFVIPLVVVNGQLAPAERVLATPGLLDEMQIGDVTGDGVDDIVALDLISGTAVLEVFVQDTTREFDACKK